MHPQFRRLVARLGTLLLSGLVGLVAAEVTLRILVATSVLNEDNGFVRFLHQTWALDLASVDRGTRLFRESRNPRLGWEPVPGASFQHVRINEHGFRGRAVTLHKPPTTLRVAVLGDSETFGMALAEEDTFPGALEEALAMENPHIEVLNFGVPGYNTAQELEILRSRVLEFTPDVVVVYYVFNDPEIASPTVLMPGGWLNRSYVYLLVGYTRSFASLFSDLRRAASGPVEYYYQLHESAYFEATRRLLAGMATTTSESGSRFILVVAPELAGYLDTRSYPYRELHARMATLRMKPGLEVCDPLPAILSLARDPRQLWVSAEDPHKNARANRAIGAFVAECLTAKNDVSSAASD